MQDLFIWKASANGSYSTKSGFRWIIQQRHNSPTELSWRWIWRLPAQENIRLFFWLAFNNSIPTMSMLYNRGILPTSECRNYRGIEETLMHCLRDCTMAKRLWRSLGFTDVSFYQETDVLRWLTQGATGPADISFIAGVWWAWKYRNAKYFNDENIPFPRLLLSALNLAETFKACFKKDHLPPELIRQITWYEREREGVILNVDGSSLGNPGPAGFGGLARNPDGGWIFGFTGHIGFSEVLAELLGIYNGLKLVWERRHRKVLYYIDSLNAKILIFEHDTTYHRYASILQDIRDLMSLPWAIDLCHSLREGNQCADILAKIGASSDNHLQISDSPPSELKACLVGDAAGVLYPRGYPNLVK